MKLVPCTLIVAISMRHTSKPDHNVDLCFKFSRLSYIQGYKEGWEENVICFRTMDSAHSRDLLQVKFEANQCLVKANGHS